MANNVVSTICIGHRIQVGVETYTVRGSMNVRSGYKYVCTTKTGKKVTIDRVDLLTAQAEGEARVLGS